MGSGWKFFMITMKTTYHESPQTAGYLLSEFPLLLLPPCSYSSIPSIPPPFARKHLGLSCWSVPQASTGSWHTHCKFRELDQWKHLSFLAWKITPHWLKSSPVSCHCRTSAHRLQSFRPPQIDLAGRKGSAEVWSLISVLLLSVTVTHYKPTRK